MHYLQIIFIFFIIVGKAFSQDAEWVEAEGIFWGANITPAEGKKKAIEDARSEAIKKSVGVRVNQETFGANFEKLDFKNQNNSNSNESFLITSRSSSSGLILEEQIISEETEIDKDSKLPIYHVKLKALVKREEGFIDPAFKVELGLNRNVFFIRETPELNDKIEVYVKSTEDCYIYLFCRTENDELILLFPNERVNSNLLLEMGDKEQLMRVMKNAGLNLALGLPTGKESTSESLYLIATKDKVDFRSLNFTDYGEFQGIRNYKAAMIDIMNWLVQIPLNRRTSSLVSYEIRKGDN